MNDPTRRETLTAAALEELAEEEKAASPAPFRACGENRGGCKCGLIWGSDGEHIVAHTSSEDGEAPGTTEEKTIANALFLTKLRNAAPALIQAAREGERMREAAIREFAAAIEHGDEKHRAWLRAAAERFLRGDAVTPEGPRCEHCGKPATCIGQYESMTAPTPACDECCGHGCEDGHCEPIGETDDG